MTTMVDIKTVLEKLVRVNVRMITLCDGSKEKCALMIDTRKRWKIARYLVRKMTMETYGDYMLVY